MWPARPERVLPVAAVILLGFHLAPGASAALAESGELDRTFSRDGKVITDFAGAGDSAGAVAILSDDKILAVGSASTGGSSLVAFVRYEENGRLDSTFGTHGKVVTSVQGGASDLAVQADGDLVVAIGYGVARFKPDGSIDQTFGDNGIARAEGVEMSRLDLQPDNKIVAAGSIAQHRTGGFTDFAVARFNPDGTLDPTFSGNGVVATDFVGFGDAASSVALQTDGKIVAGGKAEISPDFIGESALVRYSADGTLDRSFSGDGKLTMDLGSGEDVVVHIAIQPNGKIVTAVTEVGGGLDFILARYESNGSLDPTFSGDGKVKTDFRSGDDFVAALALDSSRRIVAAGYSIQFGGPGDTDSNFALARYRPSGRLDTAFSRDGRVITDFGTPTFEFIFEGANDVVIQPDGKIVAGGSAAPNLDFDFALARYLG